MLTTAARGIRSAASPAGQLYHGSGRYPWLKDDWRIVDLNLNSGFAAIRAFHDSGAKHCSVCNDARESSRPNSCLDPGAQMRQRATGYANKLQCAGRVESHNYTVLIDHRAWPYQYPAHSATRRRGQFDHAVHYLKLAEERLLLSDIGSRSSA